MAREVTMTRSRSRRPGSVTNYQTKAGAPASPPRS